MKRETPLFIALTLHERLKACFGTVCTPECEYSAFRVRRARVFALGIF